MCEPATALAGASLAVGTATALSKYGAGQQDAASMTEFQRRQADQAEIARNDSWNQLGKRQHQEIDQASNALFDNSIRATKAADSAEVQAGEAGVAGNSVNSVARNYFREQGRIDTSTIRNTAMTVDQLQDEKRAAEAARVSRSSFAPVRAPSMLGLGLEIAGAGVSAYNIYDRRNGKTRTTSD